MAHSKNAVIAVLKFAMLQKKTSCSYSFHMRLQQQAQYRQKLTVKFQSCILFHMTKQVADKNLMSRHGFCRYFTTFIPREENSFELLLPSAVCVIEVC